MINNETDNTSVITCKEMVDLRIQGMSFEDIAQRIHLSKQQTYLTFLHYKANKFEGYEPIATRYLKKQLKTNLTLVQLSRNYRLNVQGLKNYAEDRSIMRVMTVEKIEELYLEANFSLGQICDYYGNTRFTLRKFMIDNGLNTLKDKKPKKKRSKRGTKSSHA